MSTDTMYINSSRTMPSHKGRHQKPVRLQKPDRRIENQTKLRRQQSAETPFLPTKEQDDSMSQFAYSGYGNQDDFSTNKTSNDGSGNMGFVSDDLKQLLSMSTQGSLQQGESQRQHQPLPQTQAQVQGHHGGLQMSPSAGYPTSPLPPHQGLYGPVMIAPPFMVNNMPKPGPQSYIGVPNTTNMPAMYVPMNPGRPISHPPVYPPQMPNMVNQPVAFPPQPLQPHPVFQQQNQQPQLHSTQSNYQQLEHAETRAVMNTVQSRQTTPESKSSPQLSTDVNSLEQRQGNSDSYSTSNSNSNSNSNSISSSNSKQNSHNHSKSKSSKKKSSKRIDVIPPQQVPVTFSSPSAPSSRSSKSSSKKSNHGKNHLKSDDHSKCYAGATFATEAPQVTTLPKPSFV